MDFQSDGLILCVCAMLMEKQENGENTSYTDDGKYHYIFILNTIWIANCTITIPHSGCVIKLGDYEHLV